MHFRWGCYFAWCLALGLLSGAAHADEVRNGTPPSSPRGNLAAAKTDEPMLIDGRDSERVWQRAPVGHALAQREPVYGAGAPLLTSFQIAYDAAALYVLVRAQARPRSIVVRTLRRDDASILDDDNVTIKIDPNDDRRASFNFTINTAGAQQDVLMLDDGAVSISQWDGVWQARVEESAAGYVAEYRVPFAILGIEERPQQDLGFNLVRVSVHPSATVDWTLADPPQNANSPSTYGQVTGISGVRAQRLLEFIPYVSARTDFSSPFTLDPRASPTFGTGFDARLQIGTGSYAELSALTDFSQESIDSVQIASDRFPLFFDEQRAFFINGLSELRFGQYKTRQLVDTRRIGLLGQASVPIASGLKVYGQQGAASYALLNVQTLGRAGVSGDSTDSSAPSENFSVARLRFAATKNLWLGGIVAGRHRFSEAGNDHFALGVDGELKSEDGKWSWYTFWAGAATEHPALPERRDTGGALLQAAAPGYVNRGESAYTRLRYAGQFFRPYIDYAYSTPGFDPALGYYSRTGVAEHYGTPRIVQRVNRFGIQEYSIAPAGAFTTDPAYSRILRGSVALEASALLESGQALTYRVERRTDLVDQPFNLLGYSVEARRYTGAVHTITATTPSRRWVDGFFRYQFSQAFAGYRHELSESIRVRATQHFTLSLGYDHWLGRLARADERFSFGFGNGSAVVSVTPDLSLDAIGRFSFQPQNEQLGVQARLRYRYLPGSDLYVVYRATRPLEGSSASSSNELSLKLNYYTQFGI
jgi:Carbohydrate family 9 binding domain-like